jgi:peptide/nickel transport system substrate-binding protein
MLKRRKSKLCALLMTIALSFTMLAGCGSSNSASEKTEKEAMDTIVVGVAAEPKALDPQVVSDTPSSNALVQIYENLVTQDKNMEIKPDLAESWKQIDDLTYEFKLKKGVKFHNGEELKASDVKFTFERAAKSARISHIVGQVDAEKIEVVDEYTVRIPTKEPFSALLPSLCHTGACILNEKAVTEAGEDYVNSPVGTGPYKFAEWKKGDSVSFERFEDYHGEKAKTKKILFRVIPENTNRTIELETGALDIAYDIGANDVSKIEENEELDIYRKVNFSTNYLGMNTMKEPFDELKVRQAINYAMDVDSIIASVYEGIGKPATGPLAPNVWGCNKDLKPYGYDIQKAKDLMKEAGLANGFKCTLWVNDKKERIDIAEIVQAQLKEINIDIEIQVLEWGAYLEKLGKGEHDMFILGWNTTTGDPDTGLFAPFNSANKGTGGNRAFYNNPRVDELLAEGRKTFEPEKREKIYYEAQQIIRDEAPWLFLNNKETIVGAKKIVKGFEVHPNGAHKLSNVYFE